MTDYQWHFRSQRKGDRDRNPIQNEFFSSEAVGSLISALVREGTQNSGDAKSDALLEGEPVRIRIYASEDEGALPADSALRWGEGLWDHVSADCGLRNPPKPDEPCRFLVFEDFGTTGLTGDTASDDASEGAFYCFFRAENTSNKTSDSGGSWGVGKTAFPRASSANAFFAVSTRETDARTVLMGSLTLRTHHVDGTKFTPDSWYGEPDPEEEGGGIIQPIEDSEVIQAFARDFNIVRNRENGTSIVVPWCDESIKRDAIAQAIIESNFIPIIDGTLEVTVASASHGEDLVLNADTIEDTLEKLQLQPAEFAELLAGVRLAKWARSEGEAERVSAYHTPGTPSVKWDQFSLTDQDRVRLRTRFDEGKPIALRIPVPLHKIGEKTPRTSHLDVFIQRTGDGATIRPVFVRGIVVIPDHKIKRVPGAVAIIHSSSDTLGSLLRAAEDPGHKEWSTETNNFAEIKATYKYARSYLTLARDAALRSFRLLQDLDAEEDIDLLSDVFSLAKEPDDGAQRPGGGKRHKRKKKPIIVPPRTPAMVNVSRIDGGFTITRATSESPIPKRILVRAAYDVRSKNPFKQWEPADFEFDKKPVQIEKQSGVSVSLCEGNRIILDVESDEYLLKVSGFDTERGDLIIDVRPEGRLHD